MAKNEQNQTVYSVLNIIGNVFLTHTVCVHVKVNETGGNSHCAHTSINFVCGSMTYMYMCLRMCIYTHTCTLIYYLA